MKIFNFSTGKKGELLGEWYGGALLGREIYQGTKRTGEIRPDFKIDRYSLNQLVALKNNGPENHPLDIVAEFGVEAVCFCSGQIGESGEWDWHYQATEAWIKAQDIDFDADPSPKHTPAPWSNPFIWFDLDITDKSRPNCVVISGVTNRHGVDDHLLEMPINDDEDRANAQLISAAPEMLAVIERYMAIIQLESDESIENIEEDMLAAIAKAKGGSNE
jgi:hypothetical protein